VARDGWDDRGGRRSQATLTRAVNSLTDSIQFVRPRRRPPAPPGKPTKRKSPWYLKTLIIVGSILLLISGGGLGLFYGLSARYNSQANHEGIIDPDIKGAWNSDGPLNFLILGTDSRDNVDKQDASGGANSDTIMIVHIAKGLQKAFILSIPRDSWVNIPASGSWEGGMDKINAAFAYGGAALTARTIFNMSNIRFDGAVIVNFSGMRNMVDAVGGVHVCPPYDVPNFFTSDFPQYDRGWQKGTCYDMNGEEAEVFARQRHDTDGGDFTRMKSQQLVLKALAEKATTAGILLNPVKLDALLSTAAKSLTIDNSMNLRDLALALKGISPAAIQFATLPHKGTANINGVSTVQLDAAANQQVFTAIVNDQTDAWLAAHPQPDDPTYAATA
jgi:LCP family protein required for cell wall assembly